MHIHTYTPLTHTLYQTLDCACKLLTHVHAACIYVHILRVVWVHGVCLVCTDHERLWDGLFKRHAVLGAGGDPPQGPLKDGRHGTLGTL